MASAPVPLTNVGSGYTIVTQVIPASTVLNTEGQNSPQIRNPLQKFLKGEPKALGAVQIINGIWMMAIGVFALIGYSFWGQVLHIIAGSLTVSASRKMNPCAVKAALVMNIFSAIAAGISIILLFMQLILGYRWMEYRYIPWTITGITSMCLIFSMLQFAISISISVFACKATRSGEPTMNVINMVPNPEGYIPVPNSFPANPWISTFSTAAMNHPPVDSPPAYTEIKDETEH
ncbi:hypothetical protein KOW79_010424 [Hemibagrus wyckioides]|uniref:Membrane-spanning 4-domains subfamily A member 4A-like n=1 Tax=Hemibagrus wyckioides TaxID=337641 RepID=A0A9D3NQ50_9TELE|nr:membrane-spanning 4-domains subfamily A member 15-like [Hemibagrus wyckioides]KAG7327023.1 hypothetical protein KOW79_010424 [Hemibagrus wyckioides]